MKCQLQGTTTTYHCSQGAAYAEAKLLLASIVTVPSNGFVSQKTYDAGSRQGCQVIATSCVGLLSIAKSKDNILALYNDHLFMPSIALSDAIKRSVVLLTTNSSNNII
jgi:hypothetical protein